MLKNPVLKILKVSSVLIFTIVIETSPRLLYVAYHTNTHFQRFFAGLQNLKFFLRKLFGKLDFFFTKWCIS